MSNDELGYQDKAYRQIAKRHSDIPQDGFEGLPGATPQTGPAIDHKQLERTSRLLNELLKPSYVFRMAESVYGGQSALAKGAPKRMAKAAAEVDEIVRRYVRG